jgi:hypothetical protein
LILGIDIIHDIHNGTLDLCQPWKILDLAAEFKVLGLKPLVCPLPTGTNLHVVTHMAHEHGGLKYCCLVGALLYITLTTHLNVLHTVVYLSCFVHAYDNTHYEAAQHVLWYLHGTAQQTICYISGDSNSMPVIHCNSGFRTDPMTLKSYSGMVTLWAGGPIAWSS